MPPYNIQQRTFLFACRIVDLCAPLFESAGLFRELGRQLLRSGTSIGANVAEAEGGETKPDFRHKIAVARKESLETHYWLRLITYADAGLTRRTAPLLDETSQLIAILTTIKKNAEVDKNAGFDDARGGRNSR